MEVLLFVVIALMVPSLKGQPIQNSEARNESNNPSDPNIVPGVFISSETLKNLQEKAQQNQSPNDQTINRNAEETPINNDQTRYTNQGQPTFVSQQIPNNPQPTFVSPQPNIVGQQPVWINAQPPLLNQAISPNQQQVPTNQQPLLLSQQPNQQFLLSQQPILTNQQQPILTNQQQPILIQQQSRPLYQNGQMIIPQSQLLNNAQTLPSPGPNLLTQQSILPLNGQSQGGTIYTVLPVNSAQNILASNPGGSFLVPVPVQVPSNQVFSLSNRK